MRSVPGQATLPSVLDLACAELLLHRLRELCAQDGPVVVNGALVERAGTACLQILLAAARMTRARGLLFNLEAPSSPLRAAIQDLGLGSLLLGGQAA